MNTTADILQVFGDVQRLLARIEQMLPAIVAQPMAEPDEMSRFVNAVCRHYGLLATDLVGRSRTAEHAEPRMVCYYMARNVGMQSFSTIARSMGHRTHGAAISGCNRIAALMDTCPRVRRDVEAITEVLRS